MHHEGFVEERRIDRHLAVADVDHRSLRERREQLVRGMRDGHGRIVLAALAAVHAVAAFVQRIEARVREPGLVVMDAIDRLAERGGRRADVVAEPVVGRVRQRRHDRWSRSVGLTSALSASFCSTLCRLDLRLRHRADQAAGIAPRHQVHRNRTGQIERVVERLVAVAVDEHDVAIGHGRLQDDLVASRAAADREVREIRAEHARGVFLGRPARAAVIVQRTERADRDREIRAQHLLAVELEKRRARRRSS